MNTNYNLIKLKRQLILLIITAPKKYLNKSSWFDSLFGTAGTGTYKA
jgi:hypothetical protein